MAAFGPLRKLRRFLPLTYKQIQPSRSVDLDPAVEMRPGYFPTNPSFVKVAQGRLAYVRGVNYIGGSRGAGPSFTVGDSYHSIARFVLMENGATVRTFLRLDEAFEGAEDIRLFAHSGEPWCVYSQPGPDGRCTMALARIDLESETVTSALLASPFGFDQEKNWSPFSHDGAIHLVYSFNPLIILKVDETGSRVDFVDPEVAKVDTAAFEFLDGGSGAGVSVANEYLFAVHRRSVRLPDMRRIYVHRFARLSARLDTVRWGPYFVIGKPEVQFVAAIEMSSSGACEMSFGRSDRHACLAELSAKTVARLLP
ncbi:hypothetical protein ACSFA0_20875 [Variovorax sp. LT1P1]|uniref:hypothetical protein n=1 Tax=Variovorax sp. LT1P1 TaxID=3443730 RepID=UPI003F44B453